MGIKHLSDDEKKEFLKELFSSFSAEDLKNAIAAAAESIDPEPVPTISAREAEIQEKLARLKAKGTGSNKEDEKARALPSGSGTLAPVRHKQLDFFVADIMDAAPKEDGASMEHPIFSLKAGDKRVREYERNGIKVKVFPGHSGCATVFDKDIWIYCISQLIEAMNRGREDVSRTVRFTAYDFLVASNRGVDGRSYERLGDAMSRLAGTRIETNIQTADERERAGFGLIDSWRVVERASDHRMVAVEVTLPQWLWRSIESKHVLTISPDYFRIRKPIHRRIYELARKHCGMQKQWRVSMQVLHLKSGSSDTLAKFRLAVRSLAERDDLPDYTVLYDHEEDMVVFKRRAGSSSNKPPIAGLVESTGLF